MTRLAITNTSPVHWLNQAALALYILVASILYWVGIPRVPFHPDESTYLFMSADFDMLINAPLSLAWQPGLESDVRMHYRMIDAPLTRDLIGFARWILNVPPQNVDWNWSKNWEDNLFNGAYPDPLLLLTSRLSQAFFYPFSLILAYLIGKQVGNKRTGWITLVLLSVNALVLLHTRRAMAESGLLFALLLSLWGLLTFKPIWLVAILAGLAFASKQSTLTIFFVAILTYAFKGFQLKLSIKRITCRILLFMSVFTIFTFLLNPFLWEKPIQAFEQAFLERQELLDRQVTEIGAISQGQILKSIPDKILGLTVNLFFMPPAISDVGNYDVYLEEAILEYRSNPLNSIMRNPVGGTINIILSLCGFGLMLSSLRRYTPQRAIVAIFLLAGFTQFASLALTVPLPFQRYAIPLVPYACISSAFCIDLMIKVTKNKIENEKIH